MQLQILRRPPPLMWTLLLTAALMIVGHVCVLPEHAEPLAGSHHETDAPGDADHAFHAASCEAILSAPAARVPTVAMVRVLAPPIVVRPKASCQPARAAAPSESPPLFVLHRALLI